VEANLTVQWNEETVTKAELAHGLLMMDGVYSVQVNVETRREAIRRLIGEAEALGELSEDWAAALYANLDEPDKADDAGWGILRGDPDDQFQSRAEWREQ
jgi:hypothetical protein